MAMIDRNFTFATNGTVTANDLHNLIDSATIYQDLITGQQPITSVGTNYELLIADGTNPNAAPNAVTVYDLFDDALSVGTYTGLNLTGALTYGTATGTRLVSANATITTGTIATLNSTTGTIATLNSTTPTFLGAITASTNTINVGSGQIFKDASGNVGIGTSSPAAKLHISNTDLYTGKLTFGGVAATGTVLNNQATDNVYSEYLLGTWNLTRAKIRSEAGTGGGDGVGGGVLTLWTGNSSGVQTERLRIDSSGNVGIGGSPADTNNFGRSLDIRSNTGAAAYFRDSDDASKYSITGFFGADGNAYFGSWGASTGAVIYTSGTERLRIDSSGGVTIAGLAGSGSRAVNASAAGLLSAASDASLKEEVVGAHIAGLDEILQIHPKMYRWKDDIANRGENASVELGFIANDVAPIIPSAAPLGNDGLYGFYDRSITAALVKAVQELSAKVTALEAA